MSLQEKRFDQCLQENCDQNRIGKFCFNHTSKQELFEMMSMYKRWLNNQCKLTAEIKSKLESELSKEKKLASLQEMKRAAGYDVIEVKPYFLGNTYDRRYYIELNGKAYRMIPKISRLRYNGGKNE